jgi:ribonuclease BN (tRNA processing enzyme)
MAGVKQYTLFHHSPRYTDMAESIKKEAAEAFFRAKTAMPQQDPS